MGNRNAIYDVIISDKTKYEFLLKYLRQNENYLCEWFDLKIIENSTKVVKTVKQVLG